MIDRTHGGDVERWAQRAGIDSREILDFSASVNPLGPPRFARRALRQSYNELGRYPHAYGENLKAALAGRHGMNPAEILLGNGSTQLIYLLCAALRPSTAMIVGPAFSEYANALTLSGTKTRTHFLLADNSFLFSTDAFFAAWEKECDLVFLANPNSVTGQLIAHSTIKKIASRALASRTTLVIDEAFIDFGETASAKRLVRGNPYFLVLRSLTKFYGIPALRLGYLLGDARRMEQLALYQEPWSVSGPALHVASACLNDTVFAGKTERWLARERRFLFDQLKCFKGLRPFASKANFLLVQIEHRGAKARDLRDFLLRRKILVRACDSFGLDGNYFRVAVRRRPDNRQLLTALRQWLDS